MNRAAIKEQTQRVSDLREAMLLTRLQYLEGLCDLRRLQRNHGAVGRLHKEIKRLIQTERARTDKAMSRAKPTQNPKRTQTKPRDNQEVFQA